MPDFSAFPPFTSSATNTPAQKGSWSVARSGLAATTWHVEDRAATTSAPADSPFFSSSKTMPSGFGRVTVTISPACCEATAQRRVDLLLSLTPPRRASATEHGLVDRSIVLAMECCHAALASSAGTLLEVGPATGVVGQQTAFHTAATSFRHNSHRRGPIAICLLCFGKEGRQLRSLPTAERKFTRPGRMERSSSRSTT